MAFGRRGRREPPDHELFPGFSDVTELGYGSIATVYRAYERSTEREVALKLLNIRDIGPRAIESFEREARALGALSSHPNIVTLFRTFQTADGRPVLVLELCRSSVYDRVRHGSPIPAPEAVRIGIKIAGALETAHQSGILHRDVKPQNILVTQFGEPALADFGVAMLQSATQTTAGLFDFTTLHAAPELLEGTSTSPATDVYELASSLYHLIGGQSAFRAYEGESPAAVILRILRDPVHPIRDVPVELSDVLLAAMSKDATARPTTAAEFSAALSAIEAQYGWGHTTFPVRTGSPIAQRTPVVEPASTPLPASPPPPPAAPPPPPPPTPLPAAPSPPPLAAPLPAPPPVESADAHPTAPIPVLASPPLVPPPPVPAPPEPAPRIDSVPEPIIDSVPFRVADEPETREPEPQPSKPLPPEPLPVPEPPSPEPGADRQVVDINDDSFEYDLHLADDVPTSEAPADTVPRWAVRRDAVRPTSTE